MRHDPHERAGLTYTRSPGRTESTCSPTLSTTPAGSRPKIAGSGGISLLSGVSVPKKLLTTRARLGTTPQALTSTSTSVGRGCGTAMRSSVIGAP
jgi:hypothetical protein